MALPLLVLASAGRCRGRAHESAVSLCNTLDALHAKGTLANETLFVDVGAARAYQTIVARWYGMRVLAFECRFDEVARLRDTFKADPLVTLMPMCAGEEPGHATLNRAGDSSSLHKELVSHGVEAKKARREAVRSEVVNITTLDLQLTPERLRALNVKSVGFIKIDTQGHEGAVLAGAATTVQRDMPFLFYENMFDRRGTPAWQRTGANYSCSCDKQDCMCCATSRCGAPPAPPPGAAVRSMPG